MILRLLSVLLLATNVATAAAPIIQFDGPVMGTHYSVKAVVRSTSSADSTTDSGSAHSSGRDVGRKWLVDQVQRRLNEIDARMSTYQDDSDVSRFNRADANQWCPVHEETARLIQRSIQIAQSTDGAFDITVGPLMRVWKFGHYAGAQGWSIERESIPSDAEIQTALRDVGFDKLEVRQQPPAVRKLVDGVEVDLSAIAKGYAVDQVGAILDQAGLNAWMVEVGGEVRVRGLKPDGTNWRIGIESPTIGRRQLELVVQPQNQAVATSGDYRSFFTYQGKLFSHTIDPTTGRPVDHHLASVTVTRPECLEADALATALLVMGPDDGRAWAKKNNIPALLLSRSDQGIVRQQTNNFPVVATTPDDSLAQSTNWWTLGMMTLVVFLIAMGGMAIGVIISNRRIKGSCGGLAGFKDQRGQPICDACSNPSPDCQGVPDEELPPGSQGR